MYRDQKQWDLIYVARVCTSTEIYRVMKYFNTNESKFGRVESSDWLGHVTQGRWEQEKDKIGCIEFHGRSSLNTPKTGCQEGREHRKIVVCAGDGDEGCTVEVGEVQQSGYKCY